MTNLRVRPVEGWKVNDPDTGKALAAGKNVDVPDSPYWRERVKEGVLELLSDGAAEAEAKAKAEAEAKAKAEAEAKAKAEAEAKAKAEAEAKAKAGK